MTIEDFQINGSGLFLKISSRHCFTLVRFLIGFVRMRNDMEYGICWVQVLLDEMHHASDMLASGLIGLHDPQLAKTFYNPDIPLQDKVQQYPS